MLRACRQCGLAWNDAFEPERMDYAHDYESTQAFSPTFRAFHRRLAADLVARLDLAGRTVVEIGCGQGEFLALLCDAGVSRGTGFDPAYRGGVDRPDVTVVAAEHDEAAIAGADAVLCKMTLEHVADGRGFLEGLRRAIGDRPAVRVFLQVPDAARILSGGAFWDVYYEHRSFFAAGSLARLFRRSGFAVNDLWREYGDQYLLLVGRPDGDDSPPLAVEEPASALVDAALSFARRAHDLRGRWDVAFARARREGRRVVVWGGGSKAVAFLNAVGERDAVHQVVDVNPRKRGTFLAGTGHAIVGPDDLGADPPDAVVIMNPVYREEIAADLAQRGFEPVLAVVDEPVPLEG